MGHNNFVVGNDYWVVRLTVHSDGNIFKGVQIEQLIIFGTNNFFDQCTHVRVHDYGHNNEYEIKSLGSSSQQNSQLSESDEMIELQSHSASSESSISDLSQKSADNKVK